MRMASCRPRPITWLARSGSGTASPMSRLACRMHSTMVAAESMIVPSQSKTMSGYLITKQKTGTDHVFLDRRAQDCRL
jgi:hypothetical protein